MKNLRICWLLLALGFMLSCASSTGPLIIKEAEEVQSFKVGAAKFEEVGLTTSKGDFYRGKIISLEEGTIEFRPSPYWGVEPIRLDLGEIGSIRLADKPSRAGKGFVSGLGWTYTIVGGISAMGSKYNEDYEEALYGSAIIGLAGGVLGFLIGTVQDATTKTRFDFSSMSAAEKEQAIRKIMGLPKRELRELRGGTR